MKAQTLIILVIAAILLGGTAILTQRSEDQPSALIGRRVLGALPLNDIAMVEIITPDGATHLAVSNGVWVSQQDFGYPADFARIKSAVLKLAELRIGQVVNADASDKAAMKLVSPINSPDGGTLVKLKNETGQPLASLLVGDTRKRSGATPGRMGGYPDGQYVSPDGGDTVCLITETLHEFGRNSAWLDQQLVNVPGNDVATVRIAGPARDTLELNVEENGAALTLDGLDEDEEMDTTVANSIKSALSPLRFESVADPALDDATLGLDTPATFTVTTTKGAIYTVLLGRTVADAGNRYARIRVALAPAAESEATANEDAVQTEAAQQAAAEAATRRAEERVNLEQQTAELNDKLAPWTYVIASYKADAVTSTRDTLVKAVEAASADAQLNEDEE